MFAHLKAGLERAKAQASMAVAEATERHQAAQQQVDALLVHVAALEEAVRQAEGAAQPALTTLTEAQRLVEQRSAQRSAALSARSAARAKLMKVAGEEPPETTGRSKPNPEYAKWRQRLRAAERELAEAESALRAAEDALSTAAAARDQTASGANAATARVNAARAAVADASASVEGARRRVAEADAEVAQAQAALATAQAAPAELDQREQVLRAEPLDHSSIEAATDAEFAELSARHLRRHQLWQERSALTNQRATLLAEHDRAAAALAEVSQAISGWPDTPRFPGLPAAAADLASVVASASEQRTRPLADRSDDLTSSTASVERALAAVRLVVAQAVRGRDQAADDLAAAAETLRHHQERQP